MPPVSTTYTNPTGKRALMSSFKKWLAVNVPTAGATDFTYGFLQAQDPSVMPRVDVADFRYFDPGDSAMGGVIFPAAGTGQQKEGKINRCLVELDIYTDQGKQKDAYQKALLIRDRLVYGLTNSGVSRNSDNVVLVPEIKVLDPANSDFDTGTTARVMTEQDNWLIENYFGPTTERPLIHQIQLLVKLEWFEMR